MSLQTANSSPRSPFGPSAAMAGLMISATAASIMSWPRTRDVNLLVLDTEVYSNTGGQSSKSTPTSATAKFAASGKRVAKKDLGAMLMQYGYVYVAQVAMGADQAQTLKALREAESYDGPSIVICYCPCLEQHIKAGMGTSQDEMKKAVECGYWHLYRYDPRRIAEGKNPFQLDSKEPDTSKVMDFLMGENRFASLKNNFPDKADALYAKEVEDVKARYRQVQEAGRGLNLRSSYIPYYPSLLSLSQKGSVPVIPERFLDYIEIHLSTDIFAADSNKKAWTVPVNGPRPCFLFYPQQASTSKRSNSSFPLPFSAEKGIRVSRSVSSSVSRISSSAGST